MKHGIKRRYPFECPYDLQACGYVDTEANTISKDCADCERYGQGVRPSRGTPALGWIIEKITLIYKNL